MGGKTQQRVAGNVKPSNSGRIRELMDKHVAGKMITFSALSNNDQQQSINPKSNDLNSDPNHQTSQGPASPGLINRPNNKPTLVMRRIGNRDCFTLLKATKNQTNNLSSTNNADIQDVSPKTHISSPYFITTKEMVEAAENKLVCDEQGVGTASFNGEPSSMESKESEISSIENPEEVVYDFESILDQLTQIQESSIQIQAEHSLDELNEDMIAHESELMNLLTTLVRDFSKELSIEEWDLIVSSIYKWISLVLNSTDLFSGVSAKINFCINVLNFINHLILLAEIWRQTEGLKENFPMMQSLLDDWDNFHSSNAYQDLIVLFFKLAPVNDANNQVPTLIEALANIVIDVDPKLVVSNIRLADYLDARVVFDPELELPENSRYAIIDETKFKGFLGICGLFRSNHRVILVPAHAMLSKIMDDICKDVKTLSMITDQDDIDNLSVLPPTALMSILISRDSMMSALLSDYRVGDISVTIEPNSDAYTCTLTYLFVWDLVIKFIIGIDKEVGHRIIHCLKELGLLSRLLDYVFILLPPLGERDSLNFRIENDDKNEINIRNQSQWCLSNFLKSPLKTTLKRPVNEIELTALHVYFSVARHMPVTVRRWYNNNSNKRLCNLVNEYTVKHISEVICSLEMETVQEKCQERASEDMLNNLVIKARPSAKEVYSIYTRDEFVMELTIKLPINYPLGSVQIDGGERVGVTSLKWRSWLLQLITFLSQQNGPILDGIDLWKRNIDKKFEGIEKCMICFSILHSSYRLPKKKCLTCSKMFHNLCLYKWFESSGNCTCPLCRNTW